MNRLQIDIRPLSKKRLEPGVLTKRFHAFIFSVLKEANPELADQLHERKQRQMFSFCVDRNHICIHSPEEQVIQALVQGLLQVEQIDLLSWKGKIQEIHWQKIREADVKATISTYVNLHFLTPTTFFHGSIYYPLPELYRLLTSANKAYEMYTGSMAPQEKLITLTDQIRIENFQLKTKRVNFEKIRILGFCGRLDLNLKALSKEDQTLAWKLLVYGSLMGFGYKTAWGLGQTRMEPFEQKHRALGRGRG
jgi:CRISPR-associated endoribonuclease Cas6